MTVIEIFEGSDGAATKALYAEMEARGPVGLVAANLFRAQKCSARAKAYRGGIRGMGSFRGMAYDRKNWAMQNLCAILLGHGDALGIRWGWRQDPKAAFHAWVLYVDLPQGQVSFHSAARYAGPDYPGDWDGQRQSAERIIAFCEAIRQAAVVAAVCYRHGLEKQEPAVRDRRHSASQLALPL